MIELPLEKTFPHAQIAMRLEDQELLAKYASLVPEHSTIVEIGTNRGWSAVLLALASPESAVVWTIDHGGAAKYGVGELTMASPDEAYHKARGLIEHRQKYEQELADVFGVSGRIDKIHFLFGSSHHEEWMDAVEWDKGAIDLLFVDGDHCYSSVMADLLRWAPKVVVGGYMILHDYVGGFSAVPAAVTDYFDAYPEWQDIEQAGLTQVCWRIKEHKRP